MNLTIDEIIRTPRRTLSIQLTTQAKLIVRAPLRLPQEDIVKFITKKEDWIKRHQQRLLERLQHKQQQQWPSLLLKSKWLNIYRYLAFTLIRSRCQFYAQQHQLTYQEIKISNAKTRWGSCSPNGNLSFNWRLVLAPLFVIDYLVVHELAHLVVKNHSRHFWKKVETMFPSYKQAESWLKHNGYLLDI